MKTFQEFQEAALALPLAAPIGKAALPIIAGGIKLASDVMKADTAKPRKPSVQRAPDMSPAARQKRQAQQDRRAAAAERNRQREAEASKKIDDLIGSDADRQYAKQRRENPALRDAEAKQRVINDRRAAMRERMRKAAEQQGLD